MSTSPCELERPMEKSIEPAQSTPRRLPRRRWMSGNRADRAFRRGTLLFALTIVVLILLIGAELTRASFPAIRQFGAHFLVSRTWDPIHEVYGALPFVYGTLVSSFLALLFAVPISLGTAVFLSELAPGWMRGSLSFLVELLAAVPSVVYGLWGIFVLVPVLRPVEAWLGEHFGFLPIFQGPPYGVGMLAGGLILAIMIVPFITAVSREVLQAVPPGQREASYALGATPWETISGPVFRYARPGILGAVILGLGRALGETMAVTMLIGNRTDISVSLFNPGYTMASVLANEFAEATNRLYISSLMEIGLLLFVVTIVLNAIARLLVARVSGGLMQGVRE